MALVNSSSAIYLTISDGKLVRQFKTPTASSTERVTKTGKTVHEERYDSLEGRITGIETRENDYGKFWNIKIVDDGVTYIVQFNYSGGTASAFLKTLPNVDLSKNVKLTPKQTIENDKKKSTLFINQDGQPLKWYWKKDNPGDLPQLQKLKVKGKEVWDDSAMMEFLESYVNDHIIPQLGTASVAAVADADEEAPF